MNATGVAYNTSLGGGTLTLNGGDDGESTLETAQFDINAGTAVDTTVFIGGTVDLKGGSAFNSMLWTANLTSRVALPLEQLLAKAH